MMYITTLDQYIAEFFNNNFNIEGAPFSYGNLILSVIAIILTIILTSFIGYEREKRGRSAGLRTHMLVGVGSCIIMILSVYGFPKEANFDSARLAAQVVAGVGFLGAGAIIHNNGGIKGLTTASTIWIAMAIGLTCGSMNFLLAIFATVISMIILTMFRKIESNITRTSPYFTAVVSDNVPITSILMKTASELGYSVGNLESSAKEGTTDICIMFRVSSKNREEVDVNEFIRLLNQKAEIISIEVLNQH